MYKFPDRTDGTIRTGRTDSDFRDGRTIPGTVFWRKKRQKNKIVEENMWKTLIFDYFFLFVCQRLPQGVLMRLISFYVLIFLYIVFTIVYYFSYFFLTVVDSL